MTQRTDMSLGWNTSIAVLISVTLSVAAPVTDGNVVAFGSNWRPEHVVVTDGDDNRVSSTWFEFEDSEDIDVLLMWIDVTAESMYVA